MFEKIIKDFEQSDSVERISILSLTMILIAFVIIHLLLTIVFLIVDADIAFRMSFVNLILAVIALCFLLDSKKESIGMYMIVSNVCFYIICCSFYMGYERNATMIYPILLLLVHTVFPKRKKLIHLSTTTICISLAINIYMRFNLTPEYVEMLKYIEIINIAYAFGGTLLIIYTRNIAEGIVKQYAEKLDIMAKEANFDFLTGLYNRRFIEKRFENEEIKDAYIVMADIDFFKKVNDTYGHNCGDYVIQEIAHILKTSFRPTDDVCRWGGEEFLIYIKDVENIDVDKKLNTLRERISKFLFEYEEIHFNKTISIGYTRVNDDLEVAKNIENADTALYHAKQTGRNKVVNYEEIEKITDVDL